MKVNYITLNFLKYYANKSSMLFSPNTFLSREQKLVLLPARMMIIMVVVGKSLSLPSTSYGPISGRKDISHAHNNFLEIGLSSPFLNRTFLLQVQREESFLLPLTRRSKLPQITTLKQRNIVKNIVRVDNLVVL